MNKNLYVGNLSFDTAQDKLQELFETHGQVAKVNLITDRYSGRSRGFAFVEMEDECAECAVSATDGVEFEGRSLKVNIARPRGVWRLRRPRH